MLSLNSVAHEQLVDYFIEHPNIQNRALMVLFLNMVYASKRHSFQLQLTTTDTNNPYILSTFDSTCIVETGGTIYNLLGVFTTDNDNMQQTINIPALTHAQITLCIPYIRALYSLSTIEQLVEHFPRLKQWDTLYADCQKELTEQLQSLSIQEQVDILHCANFLDIQDRVHNCTLHDSALEALGHTLEQKLNAINQPSSRLQVLDQLPIDTQRKLGTYLLYNTGLRTYIHKQYNTHRDSRWLKQTATFPSKILRIADKGEIKNFLNEIVIRKPFLIVSPNYTGIWPNTVITTLSWSPDNKYIVSGNYNGTECLWDVATGTCLRASENPRIAIVSWSPNNKYIAAGYENGTVVLQDPHTLESKQVLHTLAGASITGLNWSPDGNLLAIAAKLRPIYIWNPEKQDNRAILPVLGEITHVKWSPNGKYLAIRSIDRFILWSEKTQKEIDIDPEERMVNFDWLTDNKHIIAQHTDVKWRERWLQIWDTETGRSKRLSGNPKQISYAPNGAYLATVTPKLLSAKHKVQLVSPTTGEHLHTVSTIPMASLGWSPDSSRLACGLVNGTIQVTDIIDRNLDTYLNTTISLQQILLLMRAYHAAKQQRTIYDSQLCTQFQQLDARIKQAIKPQLATKDDISRLQRLYTAQLAKPAWGLLAGYTAAMSKYTALVQNSTR